MAFDEAAIATRSVQTAPRRQKLPTRRHWSTFPSWLKCNHIENPETEIAVTGVLMLVTPHERIQIVFEVDKVTHGNSLVRTQENLRKESLTIYLKTFHDLTAIDSFVYHITTTRVSGCPGKPQDEPLSTG